MAEISDAGAGIQDYPLTAERHLHATGVATKLDIARARGGDASSYPPKLNLNCHVVDYSIFESWQ
jgi:hypothetical protein